MPPQFRTIQQVADEIGCHRSTVSRAAHALGIGTRIHRSIVFTKAEAEQIRKAVKPGPGNPHWRKG